MIPASNSGWRKLRFWKSEHFKRLSQRISELEASGTSVLPHPQNRLKAFHLTSFNETRCVILGQDPYPTKAHAHGLAFSVMPNVKPIPKSLRNILKEYQSDLGLPKPRNGSLEEWAKRGVLLLNTILTVTEGASLSHAGFGWEKLAIEVVSTLSREKEGVVFMLFGKKAQELRALIDESKHFVIATAHPSPYSAKKFLGSKPFSKANAYRTEPINWRL